jgi:hypothetical protein
MFPLANAQIRTIDGKVISSDQQLGATVFATSEPGLYAATQGDQRVHVAVNLANPTFSDVNRSVFKTDKSAATPALLAPSRALVLYVDGSGSADRDRMADVSPENYVVRYIPLLVRRVDAKRPGWSLTSHLSVRATTPSAALRWATPKFS